MRNHVPGCSYGYAGCSYHDISVESGWRARVHKSGQTSTRDRDLQGEAFMDPALVNAKRVNFHVFDLAGSIGADVMVTDPTAPSYVERGWDESRLLRECERAKREEHVLNEASMIPSVMTTFGKVGPSAESYLQRVADVTFSTGFVDRRVWLRIAQQFLS